MTRKAVKASLAGLVFLVFGIWLFGPREPVRLSISHDQSEAQNQLKTADLDAYLAERERQFDDIIDGVEKQIIWAGEAGVKTQISIVYLHGFTATSKEIRPVPDQLAAGLGANLYLGRFTGHGRRAPMALADATVARWMDDVGEAVKIGGQLGDRVFIIATSTGGTLAAAAALDTAAVEKVAGIIFISPNFAIRSRAASLLTWPFARQWVPLVVGSWQKGSPRNEQHARYWTIEYPTTALMPMAAIVAAVDAQSFADVQIPALFYYSREDQVVVPEKIAAFAKSWGGPAKTIIARMTAADDKFSHIIAGDIVSPNQTQAAVGHFLAWIKDL